MKNTIYNLISLISLAAVLFAAASCEEDKPVEPVTPEFPELVTQNDVVPGTQVTLTFTPNMDWVISVPEGNRDFKLIDEGGFKNYTLRGKASDEPVTINIWTNDAESFSIRACDVEMTMGGETRIIAKYTLLAKDRIMEVYKASVTDAGSFEYKDGGYVYEASQIADDEILELVWDENEKKFIFPVMVKANFEWTAKWPSWARADIDVGSKDGDVTFEIYGIPSMLPLDAADGVVLFMNSDEQKKSIKVRIPGCRDKFSYTLGGNLSLNFDHAAYFHSEEGSATNDPVQGLIFGPESSHVVVLELTDAGYVEVQESWLDVTVSAWDSVEGSDVLQTRDVSVSVPRYVESVDRHALLLFLPATAPESLGDILSSDKMTVKDEYSSYAVPVVQKGRPEEYFTFEAEDSELVSSGLLFARSESDLLPDKNFSFAEGTSQWQYTLQYTKEMASTKSAFYITEQYESLVVYDTDGNEIAESDLPGHWLSYNSLDGGLYGQIVMDVTKFTEAVPSEIDGYIVFKDELGKVLSVVHCFYKEEVKTEQDVLKDVSATFFRDPTTAAEAGATIHQVISGPTYEAHKEHQAPIYIVRYTKDDTSLVINTSRKCSMYSCQGKKYGPEMVTIDDQIFTDPVIMKRLEEYSRLMEEYKNGNLASEPKYPDVSDDRSTMGLLTFGATSFISRSYPGYSKFNMKMPEGVEDRKMSEVIQFSTSESILYVFICELDLSQN